MQYFGQEFLRTCTLTPIWRGEKMRVAHRVVVVVATLLMAGIPLGLLTGCGLGFDVPVGSAQFTAARKAAVEQEVRQFAAGVSRDITQQGPAAWEKHFADDPAFFMADEGKLVFPNRQAATQAIGELSRTIQHIQLTWGDDLRVDPLTPEFVVVASTWQEVTVDKEGHQVTDRGFFTGLAERNKGQWQFRNAHWSVAVPPAGAK
jgi:hypothetical protein